MNTDLTRPNPTSHYLTNLTKANLTSLPLRQLGRLGQLGSEWHPLFQIHPNQPEAPEVPAFKREDCSGWQMLCFYCNAWHYHGTGLGHRVAHCSKQTPFTRTGYILRHFASFNNGTLGFTSGRPGRKAAAFSKCQAIHAGRSGAALPSAPPAHKQVI